ncbi:hemerythrin domain-containing protein [Pantanalinema rosaneae CENA516]|uniref:hemerythrin domain-containing protein n=1 Tax=Pantanalinema rosaneae TaxID=1620701 RepID=UPI003D7006A7
MARAQNILLMIENEHREVEQLFDQFESAGSRKKVQECFNQIYKELSLHAQAEELAFYPAMREYEEIESYIEEAESEHNSVKILLEQMKALKPEDAEFKLKMTHLKEAVIHHIKEEESEIFTAVRECMNEEKLEELGQRFQEAKQKWQSEVEAALARK